MRLSTVLAACAPSGIGGLAAHPQRQARRRGRVAGGDDAGVVDAGQRLVGEQPAQRVGAQPAAGGQLRARRIRRSRSSPRWAALRPSASTTASGAHLGHRRAGPSSTVDASRASHLATDRRPGSLRDGPSTPPQTSVTVRPCSASSAAVSMPVRPGADDRDRGAGVQLVHGVAQPLRLLQFSYRISEFGGARDAPRARAGAAHRVDEVVVVQRRRRTPAAPDATAASMRSAVSTTSRTPSPSSVP